MDQWWQSLRTRLIVGVLCATVISLWAVTLLVSRYLREDMEAAVSSQQFSTVSLIAAEIDRSVKERINVLHNAAQKFQAGGASKRLQAQDFLETQFVLQPLFNWGVVIADAKGTAIGSVPVELDRLGTHYGDLPFFQKVLETGQTLVSEPMIGRRTKTPVLTIAVPIKSADGRLIGVILGITNLQKPNFLDEISTAKYGQTGDFLLTGPQTRTFIASSDKQRVMKVGPAPGVNFVYDRYINGYDGSGVAVSSRGIEELSSSKRIESTGWLMQSVLPTEEAFVPIRRLQRRLMMISLILTLLTGVVGYGWLRRQLKPLEEAALLLDQMREGSLPRQPLPIRHHDEIGKLANAFNGLLKAIVDQEALQAEIAAIEKLRKILAHVPGMIFQYQCHADGTGAFPFASEAVQDIFGVSPADVETNAGSIRALLLPEDADKLFSSMQHSAETLQRWLVDYRIQMPGGLIKWLHVDAVPEKDANAHLTWYGFVTDVTATKAMEVELESHRNRLEELIRVRTTQLAAAKAAAEAANVAKSAFLANMSHEIRTPLNAIAGMVYLVRRAGVTPEQEARLDKIEAAEQHLLALINAIIDLSKIESGKFDLEESDLRLDKLLHHVAAMLKDRAAAKQLTLLVAVEPLNFQVLGDAKRLQQALLNYASNAIKFTEQGTVTLSAKLEEESAEHVRIRFEVADTGVGIEPGTLPKLFAIFEQADNSMTRKYGGTGLGLVITKKIAQLMGGEAGVLSIPGVGSTFWFTAQLRKGVV
jgi:signal transduction histidine kinase